MTNSFVFHRRLDRELPVAARAEGIWIYDSAGRKYIDASGGPICVNVGHGRQEIVEALREQAQKAAYVHGPMFTTEPVEKLAESLAKYAPQDIRKFYFCSSGCEAVETAFKLSRQIHLANGQPQRYRIISRWLSYHGATLGALAAGGKTSMRQPFEPMLAPSVHIPAPYCLRCHYHLDYPSCELRCAWALDDAIRLEGPQTISAFIAEPICGSTVGAVVPPFEYYKVISDICITHGIHFILDEVMTGMGRTGKWFAAEHYDVAPDMVVLGKGLSGGYLPLSAVGCRREHVAAIRRQAGNFIHGHTFSHHAVAAAAGLKVVQILETENLIERAAKLGKHLEAALQPLERNPHVAEIRGKGLMWSVELVQDKRDLKPYPRSGRVAERMFEHLFAAGVITYPCAGFVNGDGDAVMIGPPFIITEAELDEVIRILAAGIDALLG
ncbi:MAG TPA: aspartate aminotransferase family protein [Desulfobacterales bacterium]